jgi:hypothetical protein
LGAAGLIGSTRSRRRQVFGPLGADRADHLGNAKVSMMIDRYMSRGRVHPQVAELLDRAVTENVNSGRP